MRIGKKYKNPPKEKDGRRNNPGRPKKQGPGAPVKYNPAFAKPAFEAAANLGANMHDLAVMFGVTDATVYNWMRTFPDFYLAIHAGRDERANRVAEHALLKCVTGYDHKVIEEKVTNQGEVVQCERTIHVAADYKAAAFWLCNRMKDRWQAVVANMQKQINFYDSQPAFIQNQQNNGNGNGKEKGNIADAEIAATVLADADGVRAVIDALKQAGAFDTGLSLPGPAGDKGSDTKTH